MHLLNKSRDNPFTILNIVLYDSIYGEKAIVKQIYEQMNRRQINRWVGRHIDWWMNSYIYREREKQAARHKLTGIQAGRQVGRYIQIGGSITGQIDAERYTDIQILKLVVRQIAGQLASQIYRQVYKQRDKHRYIDREMDIYIQVG